MKQTYNDTAEGSQGLSISSLTLGALGGYLLGSKSVTTAVQPPGTKLYEYSFPDVWRALYVDSNPTLDELGALNAYMYLYRPVSALIATIRNSDQHLDFEQSRFIIKELFDRYQCRLLGLRAGVSIQGYHTILDVNSGQASSKVCLIEHVQTDASGSFISFQPFNNVLLEKAILRCPKRNAMRQFYVFEKFKSNINSDFNLLKATGSFKFDQDDPYMLRKLGAFMALNYGRSSISAMSNGSEILAMLDHAHIFSSANGDGAYLYLQRVDSLSKYSDFINNLNTLIYG